MENSEVNIKKGNLGVYFSKVMREKHVNNSALKIIIDMQWLHFFKRNVKFAIVCKILILIL